MPLVCVESRLTLKDIGIRRVLLKDALETMCFRSLLEPYMHGRRRDVVNSPMGVLKMWCDNSKFLDRGFLSPARIAGAEEYITGLEESIELDHMHGAESLYLQNGITFLTHLLREARRFLQILEEGPEEALLLQTIGRLSGCLAQLFSFISRYREA